MLYEYAQAASSAGQIARYTAKIYLLYVLGSKSTQNLGAQFSTFKPDK